MKNCIFLVITLLFFISIPSFAFEDVIITGNAKLTEIRVENHDVIDVFPLVTVMNDRNTLIVHPLKEGNSSFTVLKNNKNIAMFTVKVDANETAINAPDGFDVLPIDYPPGIYEYELDLPPIITKPALR